MRSGPVAPVLGILLLLLGIVSFGFYVWGNTPMEEPASPGRTPAAAGEWWWRYGHLIARLHSCSIPAGVLFVFVGALLLIPERNLRK